ncbi:DNA glycosylase AlkZ-like family protein, partial [Pseudomonas sp. FW305-17]|uniref:DNA glycosylase AlkZ-like family protein n=1 Tax=Pseudomonas sp. FW305-17 TaxID=2070681 RepID=UPI001570DC50
LVLERHRAMGILRPNAPPEIWSYTVLSPGRKDAIKELVEEGRLIPVEVEGVKVHMMPEFVRYFDAPAPDRRAIILGPLDQFMWDRKMVAHLFDFDYIWEIYTPEVKRRWGYYVLPILFG